MKTNKFLIAAIVAAGVMSPIPTMATPVYTQAQTFSFSTSVPLNNTLNFNGFNSSLGTLNSVRFVWQMAESLSNSVFSINGTSVSVGNSIHATSTTTFTGTGFASLLASSDTLTTASFTGSVNPGFSTVGSVIVGTASGGGCISNNGSCTANTINNNISLSNYTNAFGITVSNTGQAVSPTTPGVFATYTAIANGTVSLFYDYSLITAPSASVPEPTSLILIGVGLAYITTIRKKTIFPTATFA
jgi:hypothetical protein